MSAPRCSRDPGVRASRAWWRWRLDRREAGARRRGARRHEIHRLQRLRRRRPLAASTLLAQTRTDRRGHGAAGYAARSEGFLYMRGARRGVGDCCAPGAARRESGALTIPVLRLHGDAGRRRHGLHGRRRIHADPGHQGASTKAQQRPPYPATYGVFDKPTAVLNVETLANLPWIIRAWRGRASPLWARRPHRAANRSGFVVYLTHRIALRSPVWPSRPQR